MKKSTKTYTEKELKEELKKERQKASETVMDLFFALREISGTPTLKDLVKLAKRIKRT